VFWVESAHDAGKRQARGIALQFLSEEFVTIRLTFLLAIILSFSAVTFGQADSVIAQLSDTAAESFAGGMSGNGRFIVFESTGNVATENPRNEDGNTEIFLFDYAQRRIFQITDTKSVLFNTTAPATFSNVRINILNTRPVISNDGKWIAFSSNATTSRPNAPHADTGANADRADADTQPDAKPESVPDRIADSDRDADAGREPADR
jgi:Tol biopolymer transport system component